LTIERRRRPARPSFGLGERGHARRPVVDEARIQSSPVGDGLCPPGRNRNRQIFPEAHASRLAGGEAADLSCGSFACRRIPVRGPHQEAAIGNRPCFVGFGLCPALFPQRFEALLFPHSSVRLFVFSAPRFLPISPVYRYQPGHIFEKSASGLFEKSASGLGQRR